MRTTPITTSQSLSSGGKATTDEHVFVHSVSEFLAQSRLNVLSGAQLRGDVILSELRTFAALYGNGNKAAEGWIAFVGHHAAENCYRKLHTNRSRSAFLAPLVASRPVGQFSNGSRIIRGVLREAMTFLTDNVVAATRPVQTQISSIVHFMEKSGVFDQHPLLSLRLGCYLRSSLECGSSLPLGETDWSVVGARVAAEAFAALFNANVRVAPLQSIARILCDIVGQLDDPHEHIASFLAVESRVGRSSSQRSCFAVSGSCFFVRANQIVWVTSRPTLVVGQRDESPLAAVLLCTDLELASDCSDTAMFDRVYAMANRISDDGWLGATIVIGVFVEVEFDSATQRRIEGWTSRLRATRFHGVAVDVCVAHALGKQVMYKLSTSLGVLQNSMPPLDEADSNWRWWVCPRDSILDSVISLQSDEIGEDATVYSSHRSAVLRTESVLYLRFPSPSLSHVSVVLSAATAVATSALEVSFWQCFSKLVNEFCCEVAFPASNLLVPNYGYLELLASCSLESFLDKDSDSCEADVESFALRREVVTSLQNSMRQYLILVLQQSFGLSIEKAMDHVGACAMKMRSQGEAPAASLLSEGERLLPKWFYQHSVPLPPFFPLEDIDGANDLHSVLACDVKDWCSLDVFLGSVACIFRIVEAHLTTGVVGVNA